MVAIGRERKTKIAKIDLRRAANNDMLATSHRRQRAGKGEGSMLRSSYLAELLWPKGVI